MSDDATTPQPPPLKRRGGESRSLKAPSSSEEGVGGGGPTREVLLQRAAEMRKNPTEPEWRLWLALRDRRFSGYKFRRQDVFDKRIVDFFCPAKGLVIEVDGDTHDAEHDARRDLALRRNFGFDTLRFTNQDVMRNLEGVLIALEEKLSALPDRWAGRAATTPQPPPLKRRGSRSRILKAPSSSEEGVGGGGVSKGIRVATETLAQTSETPRLDAELLMAHALGVSRSDLLLRHMADPAPTSFAPLIKRRQNHEPVAYILGEQEFFGLSLLITPDVLIPRGDSEVLVEAALKALPDAARVLDCGIGSGALLLAVLNALPEAQGIGIDRSLEALNVAAANAARLGLGKRARMLHLDWHRAGWSSGLGQFDLILANPPYVETQAEIAPSVRNFEPAGALFAGAEGLDDYRILIPQLAALLSSKGVALVEIGHTQAQAVTAIAAKAGLTATLHHDLANRPRVLELVHTQVPAH